MQRHTIVLGTWLAAAVVLVSACDGRRDAPAPLQLFGNIDLREVDLPFNGTERIAAVLVQEGDRVHVGEVLARLDTRRLLPQLAQAEAIVASQEQIVARLHHGNRPEEIEEARADEASAQADANNARDHYDRLVGLGEQHIVSELDVDNAKATWDVAQAKLRAARQALLLEVAGPRHEDVAQAEAALRADAAQLALVRRQLADTALVAPVSGVVRSRLMEPGEMASPEKAVFSLAITDPKWVRAYVPEPDLGRVRPGMRASIAVDAFPGERFGGWVGFISPTAEFTPKEVQTEALRPSLVYEVRVFVHDSADLLRLGMPASVYLAPPLPHQPRDVRPTTPVPVVPSTGARATR